MRHRRLCRTDHPAWREPAHELFNATLASVRGLGGDAEFGAVGGLNEYEPRSFDPRLINPEFQTKYGIVGALIGSMPNLYAFAEAPVFDDSVGAQGDEGVDVLAIGVHYGFSCKLFHRR